MFNVQLLTSRFEEFSPCPLLINVVTQWGSLFPHGPCHWARNYAWARFDYRRGKMTDIRTTSSGPFVASKSRVRKQCSEFILLTHRACLRKKAKVSCEGCLFLSAVKVNWISVHNFWRVSIFAMFKFSNLLSRHCWTVLLQVLNKLTAR